MSCTFVSSDDVSTPKSIKLAEDETVADGDGVLLYILLGLGQHINPTYYRKEN